MTTRFWARDTLRVVGMTVAACGACAGAAQSLDEKNISLAQASELAQTALAKCQADGFVVSVVVLERGGNIKVALRGDGSGLHTLDTARRKAFTALTTKATSGEFVKRLDTNPGLRGIDGTIALAGGVPIRSGNQVIGAVGVSGAPGGDKDEACGQAGIDKIKAGL